MMQLRESVGQVELLDARSGDPRVLDVQRAGYDLDTGMVVLWGECIYFGDGAVHLLATLSRSGGGLFNNVQRAVFSDPGRARRLYPPLVRGRRLFLRVTGRQPLGLARQNIARTGE